VIEAYVAIVAGGFLLGLAGSLHCACMCGGIASGALFMLDPASPRERTIALLLLQVGRIATYAIAGGVVAGLTSLTVDPTTTTYSFRGLQWIAAVGLMWLGLSTAGVLPRLALPAGGTAALTGLIDPLLAPLRRHRRLAPVALGLSWGLTPCPMVYAALFSAALTGSVYGGIAWMLAFGAGTLPGVLAAALGVSALARIRRGPAAETVAGLAIAALGFSSFYFGWPSAGALCLTQ
jgi:hypothetical protein